MRFLTNLPLLSFLSPLTHAALHTRYSTITVLPVPLSTTVTHHHNSGSIYTSGGNEPGSHNAYYNASAKLSLSYTLSYPTTKLPPTPLVLPQQIAQPSIPSNASMTVGSGNSSPPLPPLPCTPNELYCNSKTSFSLCAPAVGGGSRYIFMGAVANGTSCEGGKIGKADGGHCSPVGSLECQGDRRFFLCNEGGLVHMGRATNETRCVDGEIVTSEN